MRNFYQKKITKILESSKDDESFICLFWACHTLQTDRSDFGMKILDPDTIPEKAKSAKLGDPLHINKWEIETLSNELLTTEKKIRWKHGQQTHIRSDNFHTMVNLINYLRKKENQDQRIQKKHENIHTELSRIANRQFPWQRGFDNIIQIYKYYYIYGYGDSAEYFQENNGVSIENFSLSCFAIYAALKTHHLANPYQICDALKINQSDMKKTIEIISVDNEKARSMAREIRLKSTPTADRPSIFRTYPCISFGKNGDRIRSPLPELIIHRMSSGLFYDLTQSGTSIKRYYADRFEKYCYNYLSSTLSEFHWKRSFPYKIKKVNQDSPDIICLNRKNNNVEIVLECKSTRMSYQSMFGRNPDIERGYDEIAKAVFQIWRFFSHCRRGLTNNKAAPQPVGVVLTLDGWLVMARNAHGSVMEKANDLCSAKDPGILEEDKKPIVFVTSDAMEKTLSTANEETFKTALIRSGDNRFLGWQLDLVHENITEEAGTRAQRGFIFADKLDELLPWWRKMEHSE